MEPRIASIQTHRIVVVALAALLAAGCGDDGAEPPTPDGAVRDGAPPGQDGPGQDGPGQDGPGQDGPGLDQTGPTPDTGGGVPYSGSFPKGSGDLSATLTVAGLARTVGIYRPSSLGAKPPLMILLHGTHGTPQDMLKPGSSYARELADKQGLVLAAPQARKMTKGDWDDHGSGDVYWETYPNVSPAQNPDLKLVQAIIQEAQKTYGVDGKRVYVLGHSNGGFFATLVAMALPGQIAAFVANSAGLVRCTTMGSCSFVGSGSSCAAYKSQAGYCSCSGPDKPTSVTATGRKPPAYLVHASDDTVISVQYMCTLAERMQALGYVYSLNIMTGHGHSMPYNLAINAWTFLSKHTLP